MTTTELDRVLDILEAPTPAQQWLLDQSEALERIRVMTALEEQD